MKAGLILLAIVPLALGWDELETKFGITSNPQPRTVTEAADQGWVQIGDGCSMDGAPWPGRRFVPPRDIPDMVLIFDKDGSVAGMQSGMPMTEFAMASPCSDSKYYLKDTINGVDFCLATMYFMDPAGICEGGVKTDQLVFQEGASYTDTANLVMAPHKWEDAQNDNWVDQKYFLGMGHHITPYEPQPEDCDGLRPYQLLYAQNNFECVNTGIVWQHIAKTPERDSWEKPTTPAIKLILENPAQCELDLADKKSVTTMHVFMGGSTTYCVF